MECTFSNDLLPTSVSEMVGSVISSDQSQVTRESPDYTTRINGTKPHFVEKKKKREVKKIIILQEESQLRGKLVSLTSIEGG